MKTGLVILISFSSLWLLSQSHSRYKIPCEPVVYPIQFYYVHNHPLLDQRDGSFLYRILDTLNSYFKPSCIQFQVCKIDTILDYNYFTLLDDINTNEDNDIRALYYNPRAINVYWLASPSRETFYGMCEPRTKKPAILATTTFFNNAIMPINQVNIARQFYKFFGLQSTESTVGSVEFVNTSNGKITADSTWDTPADPGGLSFPSPDTFLLPGTPSALTYVYTNRKDPNGDYYNPMVLNPMSNHFLITKQPYLTHEQYQKLVVNERRCRKTFWGLE